MKKGGYILAAVAILICILQAIMYGGKEESSQDTTSDASPATSASAASVRGRGETIHATIPDASPIRSLEDRGPGEYTIVIEGTMRRSHNWNDPYSDDPYSDGVYYQEGLEELADTLRALPDGYRIHLDLSQVRTTVIWTETLDHIDCLVSLILPTTLEHHEHDTSAVGSSLLRGCVNLSNIFIPSGYSLPNDYYFFFYSFDVCPNLKFTVDPENQDLSTDETGSMLLSKDGATLYCWPSAAGSVTLPKTITKISQYAFEGNTSITEVTIPDGVTEINFSGCTSLSSVSIPDSARAISFPNCVSLESVTIPDGATEINFSGCDSLKEVSIPDSARAISFSNCVSLESVTILDGAIPRIKILEDPGYEYINFSGCTSLTSVSIPSGITHLSPFDTYYNPMEVFTGCTSLKEVIIPNSVTEIGYQAFSGCSGLESIIIPTSVTEIGGRAFSGCTSLKEVIIPNSVTEIGEEVFSGCSRLESIIIPASVTEIGERAFSGCSRLESIKFEDEDDWYLKDFYSDSPGSWIPYHYKSINVENEQQNAKYLSISIWRDKGLLKKTD